MAIRKSLHVCVSLPLSKARRLEASCAILRCEGWPYTKVWRASRGDGCHGYPSQVLTSYRTVGDIAPQGGLYPCAVNTQIKTRQGDRFAQAALRLCSSFVQRRDLRNYPTFIRLNVELVASRTSRQRERAPASETPPPALPTRLLLLSSTKRLSRDLPPKFCRGRAPLLHERFFDRRCPRTSFPAPG